MSILIILFCVCSCGLFLPNHPAIEDFKVLSVIIGFSGLGLIVTGLALEPILLETFGGVV